MLLPVAGGDDPEIGREGVQRIADSAKIWPEQVHQHRHHGALVERSLEQLLDIRLQRQGEPLTEVWGRRGEGGIVCQDPQ